MLPSLAKDVLVTTTKSWVSNERIFREMDEFIVDVIRMNLSDWRSAAGRLEAAATIEDVLFEYAVGEDKIEPYSVKAVCDVRNNPQDDLANGVVILDVYYQQHNCVSRSHLRYTLELNEPLNNR